MGLFSAPILSVNPVMSKYLNLFPGQCSLKAFLRGVFLKASRGAMAGLYAVVQGIIVVEHVLTLQGRYRADFCGCGPEIGWRGCCARRPPLPAWPSGARENAAVGKPDAARWAGCPAYASSISSAALSRMASFSEKKTHGFFESESCIFRFV